jgi:hypothetical protein
MHDRWTAGVDPIDGAGNIYANLVDTFVAVLPDVSAADTATAREACRLLARSIVCTDKIVDGDVSGLAQAENVLAAQVCQLEGTRLLQTLVAPDHLFWGMFVQRLREFADACMDEASARGQFLVELATAERIAFGKNALARITGPLACVLGGDVDLVEPFDRAVMDLIVAVQALDDAIDWRDDLAAQRLSLITTRIWSQLGDRASIDVVQRYVHGAALREVLGQGRQALSDAMEIPSLQASGSWLRLTGRIAASYDRILVMLP